MDIGCTAQSNNNTPSTAFTIKLILIVKLTLTFQHSFCQKTRRIMNAIFSQQQLKKSSKKQKTQMLLVQIG